jgi:predicted nucleic acid-binding protein
MRYVTDCSVAFKWEIPEVDSDKAIRIRQECQQGLVELSVPDIFPVEVANAFNTAELKGNIAPGQFASRLADVLRVNPVLYQSTSLLTRAVTIIRRAVVTIGIYDCLYVALAEKEGCDLITADTRLLNALGAAYPFIKPVSSI